MATASPRVDVVFLVRGVGECAQAAALGSEFVRRGVSCRFLIERRPGVGQALRSLEGQRKSDIEHLTEPTDFLQRVNALRPRVLFLVSSHTTFQLLQSCPSPKPFVASIETNWLLNPQRYRFPFREWIDRFFLVMPEAVYQRGLIEHGGFYRVAPDCVPRITTPGFVPSGTLHSEDEKCATRRELGVAPDERLVFAYLGRGITFQPQPAAKLVQALRLLNARGARIKLVYIGDEPLPGADALFFESASEEAFSRMRASADLNIQHRGTSNLYPAIRAQVPSLCFIPRVRLLPLIARVRPLRARNRIRHLKRPHSPAYEMLPLESLGLCVCVHERVSVRRLSRAILRLLEDVRVRARMQRAQRAIYQAGEGAIYDAVAEHLPR